MSIVSIRSQTSFFASWGTVLVTTIFLSLLPFRASMAFPLKMPWVTIAIASLAPPWSIKTLAALTRVPHEEYLQLAKEMVAKPIVNGRGILRSTILIGVVGVLWKNKLLNG